MSREFALPGGGVASLDASLAGVLAAGVVTVTGIRVGGTAPVRPAIDALCAELRGRWSGRQPAGIPALQEARRLYHAVGIQPTRTRPSSEALLRRVLKGDELYAINNAVDACNLASLEFLLPIGLYDLEKIVGDVRLRLGGPGEEYPGIRKGPVHLDGRLGLFDAAGPFGSPTSDSERTCIDAGTRLVLGIVMATGSYAGARLLDHARRLGELLATYCGGRVGTPGLLSGGGLA